MSGQGSPYVAVLDEDERRRLSELGRVRRHQSGDVLFVEGDEGTHVLVIQRGSLKLVTTTLEGHEHLLAIRGPDELVGELSCLDEHTRLRSATAIALSELVVQVIPNDQFVRFLEVHPRALLALTRGVIARLHDADRRRLEFGAYDTLGRVARVLNELAATQGQPCDSGIRLDPPLTQHELAGLVGASRESVVRALTELRRQGIVATGRRMLVVRDPAGLARLSR